jgi:arginase
MLPADQVVLLGYRSRDLDDAAANEVARMPPQLSRVTADALTCDPAGAGQRAAEWLGRVVERSWLHLDLDVLDPSVLPAVTYPQPGGPNWDQLALALKPLAQSPQLIGVSVADFRADLDPTGGLAAHVTALLSGVLP